MSNLSASLLAGLEATLNRYLRLDPGAMARMAALQPRTIAIELMPLQLTLYVVPGGNGVQLRSRTETEPDTVLRGTPLGLAQLGLGSGNGKAFFSGSVAIEGDVETGQAFKAILDEMDIDWEEQISRLTGDVIAHQLGNTVRRAADALQRARRTLAGDIGEYLQEELRVLPTRIEIENFSTDVARLGMDTDRLAARIRRLQPPPPGTAD
ncbi:MAG TPA: SCP2 sterol-binding domain-containing protein [Gammaproteobacteria bacterium]|nr:SCP2 sterol-binding domain-containing protein [Gammaproteobacteria bacterium]